MDLNLKNQYYEICQSELISEKENTLHTETTFLDFHCHMNESQIEISLYDKKDSYDFKFAGFHCEMFYYLSVKEMYVSMNESKYGTIY